MPKKAPPPLLSPTCGNEPLGVTGKSLEKTLSIFVRRLTQSCKLRGVYFEQVK